MTNCLRAVHPGEILREDYLKGFDITPSSLAESLHVSQGLIEDIANEERGITADIALRLARYFGGDAQSWLNLQTTYDLKCAENDMGNSLNEITPNAACG